MFWGMLFISVGILLLLNYIFGIHLPVFKILVAIGFIYIGIKMLFGSFDLDFHKSQTENEAIFSHSNFAINGDSRRYKTVFGSAKLDLSKVDIGTIKEKISVDTVFGETYILIPRGAPVSIESSAAFASIELPDKNINAFGQFQWHSESYKSDQPALRLKINAVFGALKVVEKVVETM